MAAPPPTAVERLSQRDLHNYADALYQILEIRRQAARALDVGGPAGREQLRSQAQRAIYEVLARYGFNEASFNRISSMVEHAPALRRQVRDLVMRQGLGF